MNPKEIFQQTSRRITEKLARFEKLLRDPDLAPYVSALKNGEPQERPPQRQQSKGRNSSRPKAVAQKPARKKASTKKSASQKTGAPNGVRNAIRSLKGRLPANFTAEDINRELRRMKFSFTSRKPVKALSNTLFKLAQKKEIKLVKAGASGKPNTYAWSEKK
jgi:hypothetical protein